MDSSSELSRLFWWGVFCFSARHPKPDQGMKKESHAKSRVLTADFFAGIGGIRLGFEDAGFKTAFSNDLDPFCKITYDLNFKSSQLMVEDIFKIDENKLPRFDVFAGGFPCQPFSIAGYRKGFKDKGRGDVFLR